MRKSIGMLIAMSLMLAACGNGAAISSDHSVKMPDTQDKRENERADAGAFVNADTDAGKGAGMFTNVDMRAEVPAWAGDGEYQTNGEWYRGLNLDGVGDADDEVYVSVYRFGHYGYYEDDEDYTEEVTVLKIHLGTGETLAKVFPVGGRPFVQTGKLFSEGREAVVLEIEDRTSNYNATEVFVLDVFPYDPDRKPSAPSAILRLDTASNASVLPACAEGQPGTEIGIWFGTEPVDVEGMPQQALQLQVTSQGAPPSPMPLRYYWTQSGWGLLSDD